MSTIQLDIRYLYLLNLQGLESTSDKNTFRCRCCLCGDSKYNKTKKRLYFMPHKSKKNSLYYYCHNCQESGSFSFLLKTVNSNLFRNYLKENTTLKFKSKKVIQKEKVFKNPMKKILSDIIKLKGDIKRISRLEDSHISKRYLIERKIDEKYWKNIFYVENFKKWINVNYTKKYKKTDEKDQRIVFPILNLKRNIIGFQGRSINPKEEIRYLNIKLKEDEIFCYGIHNIKYEKNIYIVEGLIDKLMIDNSLAMLKLGISMDFLERNFNKENLIFIFDNEPRNKYVVKSMKKIANLQDYGLFFWPKKIQAKDLNELVTKFNYNKEDIIDLIHSNTYNDLLKKKIYLSKFKI